MTVNDITFRSQQQVEGARQFQDQRRDSAMQGIGNTVQGLGQQIQATQRYEQEFAFQQQQAEREFAMQSADANMRLALQQQEMQFNQQKLQQMAQIDMVDMSREQLRSAKLQNQATELELKRQQKMFDTMGEDRTAKTFAEINKTMSALEWNELGFEPDPTSMTFKPVDEKTQASRRESLKRQSSFRDPDAQMQQTLNGLYNAIEKAVEDGDENTANYLRERVQQLTGGGQPQASRRAAAPSKESNEFATMLAGVTGGSGASVFEPSNADKQMAAKLYEMRGILTKWYNSNKAPGREGSKDMSEQEAVQHVVDVLRGPPGEDRDDAVKWLYSIGDVDQETARTLYLRGRNQ